MDILVKFIDLLYFSGLAIYNKYYINNQQGFKAIERFL